MMMMVFAVLFLAFTFLHIAALGAVTYDDTDGSRKLELMLSMRDGIKLHTLIYLPRDNKNSNSKYTAIVDRSPYGYGDMEWITDIFLPFGFVAVGQDIRYIYLFKFICLCVCHVIYIYLYISCINYTAYYWLRPSSHQHIDIA